MQVIEEYFPETAWESLPTQSQSDVKRLSHFTRHGRGILSVHPKFQILQTLPHLKMIGVEEIVAFSSVGSLREEMLRVISFCRIKSSIHKKEFENRHSSAKGSSPRKFR